MRMVLHFLIIKLESHMIGQSSFVSVLILEYLFYIWKHDLVEADHISIQLG